MAGRNRSRSSGLEPDGIRNMLDIDSDISDNENQEDINNGETPWVDDTHGEANVDQNDSESSESQDTEEEEVEDPQGQQRGRNVRPCLRDRFVKNLDEALNEENYDNFQLPERLVTYEAIIAKAARGVPEKRITWQNKPPARSRAGRPPAHQQRTMRAGVRGFAQTADTPEKCFNLFMDTDMVEKIVNYTNMKIRAWTANLSPARRQEIARKRNISEVDVIELRALIGLWYARGLLKLHYWKYERLWENKVGHPIFAATMSLKRFRFLRAMLSFDDPTTRPQRFETDRFCAFREVCSIFFCFFWFYLFSHS